MLDVFGCVCVCVCVFVMLHVDLFFEFDVLIGKHIMWVDGMICVKPSVAQTLLLQYVFLDTIQNNDGGKFKCQTLHDVVTYSFSFTCSHHWQWLWPYFKVTGLFSRQVIICHLVYTGQDHWLHTHIQLNGKYRLGHDQVRSVWSLTEKKWRLLCFPVLDIMWVVWSFAVFVFLCYFNVILCSPLRQTMFEWTTCTCQIIPGLLVVGWNLGHIYKRAYSHTSRPFRPFTYLFEPLFSVWNHVVWA